MRDLILSVVISFVLALALGYLIIPLLRRLKAGQQIRDDGPQTHLKKAGTPTMGGIIMLLAVIITCLIFLGKGDIYIWFSIIAAVAFGLIGLLDDMIIVLKKRSLGLRAYQKIILQVILAALIAIFAYNNDAIGSKLYIPLANVDVDLGIWYIPFTMFVVIALVNSVNLTDGLDGLASGVTLINTTTYTIIFFSMVALAYPYANDMMIFSAAVTGACLGFLRYNSYPAKVFMGDTGAFFLGGALVVMAVISRLQILILLMGLMFVLTSLSCVLQVGSYKLRKKRIFKMAPLHHHFELKGVPEVKIVAVYMLITTFTCLISLLMLS